MQSTHADATVIAFGPKRRAARASGRRRAVARGVIALWFGTAALAILLLVGEGAVLLLRHGLAGLGIGLLIVSAGGWPLAGRLLKADPQRAPRKQPISQRPMPLALKLSGPAAEATDRDV